MKALGSGWLKTGTLITVLISMTECGVLLGFASFTSARGLSERSIRSIKANLTVARLARLFFPPLSSVSSPTELSRNQHLGWAYTGWFSSHFWPDI